jgi:hypothetical protein
MTSEPLKEPFNVRATLYQGDRRLAEVMCRLWPIFAPAVGMAVVPSTVDWLQLGRLTLVLRTGLRHEITPSKLESVGAGQSLLRFTLR